MVSTSYRFLIRSIALLLVQQLYFELFLPFPTIIRVLAAFGLIFPVGLFLGMAFPLGILTIVDKPNGSIAWSWAMNGLFMVVGGLASVVLSIYYGFNITLIVTIFIYLLAFIVYARLRAAVV